MISEMHRLNRNTVDRPKHLPLKIVQFGGGNFLRAFVDWMVQVLNEETDFNGGVVVVKPTERGDYRELKSQDGLFTVVLDGIKNGELVAKKQLIDCVQEVVNPYSDWDAYLQLAENPDLRFVVSNTTEAGIKFNEKDALDDNPPKEFPAKLTRWLYHRFQFFEGDETKGLILLPCELIENNGVELKKTILQYAEHWLLGSEFNAWINSANHFCNTLVDRIVSGYPKDRAEKIHKALGYDDQLLVAGEYYQSWVIQGHEIVQQELPLSQTDLNVEFVDDLVPYREMKVRILNGAHTAMVPAGYLAGIRFVSDAMDDDSICGFIESLLCDEVNTTLNFPESVKKRFILDVLDRFRNPLLKHQLLSISLNSTSKFVTRLLPSLIDYYNKNRELPKRIVFGLSALIRFYKGEFKGKSIDLKDDAKVLGYFIATYKALDKAEISLPEAVASILSNTEIWGQDLTRFGGLVEQVSANIKNIETLGIEASLAAL